MKLFIDNTDTTWGWTVKTFDELVLALEGMELFETVPEGIIEDAVRQTAAEGRHFEDLDQFAKYVAYNYT